MKNIVFEYKSCGITDQELAQGGTHLLPEIERIRAAQGVGYDSEYASINATIDQEMLAQVQMLIDQKQLLNPTMLVVIGIGGSSLGTFAVYQALYGVLSACEQSTLPLYFADTIDPDCLSVLVSLVEQELSKGGNVLLNVISKSGSTTETMVNFQILLELIKRYKKNTYQEYVIVTTDRDSALWAVAQQEHFACLEVPQKVGGRYSVFSPVGLFPLGFVGVDIRALCVGAATALSASISTQVTDNMAALSAIVLYAQYKKGLMIHDTFLFSADLAGVGAWYRQLMAESIGKEFDRFGNRVEVGMTPTVSIGPNDLHSVAQLYLAGPRDKITTFISVATAKLDLIVPMMPEFESCVSHIQGKSVSAIMNAIQQGVCQAYQELARPYLRIVLPEKKAVYMGQLLQYKMIEIMYLGFLLDINPFDQPSVEQYKKKTRKILADE